MLIIESLISGGPPARQRLPAATGLLHLKYTPMVEMYLQLVTVTAWHLSCWSKKVRTGSRKNRNFEKAYKIRLKRAIGFCLRKTYLGE